MKTIIMAALVALAFTTGFTCSKNQPAPEATNTEQAAAPEEAAPVEVSPVEEPIGESPAMESAPVESSETMEE